MSMVYIQVCERQQWTNVQRGSGPHHSYQSMADRINKAKNMVQHTIQHSFHIVLHSTLSRYFCTIDKDVLPLEVMHPL
jgi:hypothetical protein